MSKHSSTSMCLVCWQFYQGLNLGGSLAPLISPCYWPSSTAWLLKLCRCYHPKFVNHIKLTRFRIVFSRITEFCVYQSLYSSADRVYLQGCNMVDGQNCGFVLPPNDLEHHTCICGDGYMNDEGTLIPGSIIKEGYALARSAYYAHKDCAQCQIEPQKCDWRRRHLPPREKRTTITAPPDGMFEFFLNSEGISKEILHAFLQSNSDGEITCLPGKRFKVCPAGTLHVSGLQFLDIANVSCPGRKRLLRTFQLPYKQTRSQATQGAHTPTASRT